MPKSLKIGILSDSHTQTALHQEAIDYLLDEGAEYLLHAGDIGLEEHLQILEEASVPYVCVYGNNDMDLISLHGTYNIHQEPYYFQIEELKIKMMHLPYFISPDADMVVSGHTHMFDSDLKGDTLFINPGEVCARNKPLTECAMVEVLDGVFTVYHYYRELKLDVWQKRKVEL